MGTVALEEMSGNRVKIGFREGRLDAGSGEEHQKKCSATTLASESFGSTGAEKKSCPVAHEIVSSPDRRVQSHTRAVNAAHPGCPIWATKTAPTGRLPDGGAGFSDKQQDAPDFAAAAAHLREIFHRQGFSDKEIVALSGAHALGRCHEDRSGFHGPWTRSPNTFSNEYFRCLLRETWKEKKTHNGGVWKGPRQFEDEHTGELMMLPTDLALLHDPDFAPHVRQYADSEELFLQDFAKSFRKLVENGVPLAERHDLGLWGRWVGGVPEVAYNV